MLRVNITPEFNIDPSFQDSEGFLFYKVEGNINICVTNGSIKGKDIDYFFEGQGVSEINALKQSLDNFFKGKFGKNTHIHKKTIIDYDIRKLPVILNIDSLDEELQVLFRSYFITDNILKLNL